MKLRNKILISISLAWLVFLALTYIGSRAILIQSFLNLEEDRADRDLDRVDQALDQVSYSLYTFTSDWSHWNDLYDYAKGTNPSFVPNNLNMTAYVNSHINFMTFWNKEGKLLLGTAVDTKNQKLIAYSSNIDSYIFPSSKLMTTDVNNEHRGYILTANGIMLIASCALTDGDKLLPPLGTSIFGRNLDDELVKKIAETTKVDVRLYLPDEIKKSKQLSDYFKQVSGDENSHISIPIDNQLLEGYSIIWDVFDKPIGMFKMTTPRAIYQTGLQAVTYYLMTFIVLAIMFSALILWLLRRLIVRRLERLDSDISYIKEKNALHKRVDAEGGDELSSVATEINKMLDIIQASHSQLENRVEERTQELQQTNVQLQQEITERRSVERELIIHKEHLVRLAHYDSLTSLPNRVFFNEILNKGIHHAKRSGKLIAVLFVDLDRFKNINDALGHPIGDRVLKEMGQRFAKVMRAGDILARLGGDEFIILLNDIGDSKFAAPVAEKLMKACEVPVKVETHEFYLTASIGICVFPGNGDSMEDVLKYADMAMYKAKRGGGNSYQFYSEEMNTAAHEHIKVEAALRRAIQNNEFVLHFQPQMQLSDGSINRVEALIRWEDPENGLIPPMKFIPLAEETGLILPIGEWAIHEACRVAKQWQDDGYDPVTVAVNISPKQFRHQDLAKIVTDALTQSKLQAKYLEIEITETAIMDNVDTAINRLNNIAKMGVRVSVDDFGTGYTSISYLKQFPVSILKIDQSFVKGLPENQDDRAITTAVIALAHNLNLEVIAEGVETAEQLQFLADHHCDLIQGYFLSRPLPANKVILQFKKRGEVKDTIIEN